MCNEDVRDYAKKHNVNLWQVSEVLGYAHESAFSRVLRHELPEEKKKEIMLAVDKITTGKGA